MDNTLNKIRLSMSYDMRKTLNENQKDSNIQMDEANYAQDIAKLLKSGVAAEHEFYPFLARLLKTSEKSVAASAMKDSNRLASELKSAIKDDFKNNIRVAQSNVLGDAAKEASKANVVREILDTAKSKGKLSEDEIIAIIERNKNNSKKLAREYEAKMGTTKPGPGETKPGETKPGETKPGETGPKPGETGPKPGDGGQHIPPQIWDPIKKALKAKWIAGILGAAALGGAGYLGLRALGKNLKPGEEPAQLPECLVGLLSVPGCTMESTSPTEGDPVIFLTKTGDPEYDKAGGLKFYMDNSVKYANGQRNGRWECKATEPEVVQESLYSMSLIFENILTEQELLLLERDITDRRYRRVLRRTARNLKNDINAKNIKRVLRILSRLEKHTFEGQPVLPLIISDYKQETGRDMIVDVQKTTALDAPGRRDRQNLIDLLQKQGSAETVPGDETNPQQPVGNPLDNITITWDDGGGGAGGSQYTECDELPFQFGCHNDRVREMQLCLGMPVNLQTGNFGPKTKEALIRFLQEVGWTGYNLDENGIDETLYKMVLQKCKGNQPVQPVEPERQAAPERIATGKIQAPTLAQQPPAELAKYAGITTERMNELLDNIKRNRKYVGPPLTNPKERAFVDDYTKKLGFGEVGKEKMNYQGGVPEKQTIKYNRTPQVNTTKLAPTTQPYKTDTTKTKGI